MSMWTNALFAMQIQVCQLVIEPRNFAVCVTYVRRVSSVTRFYHWYLQHKICYKELHTFIENNSDLYMTAKYEPHRTKTSILFGGGLNNRHIYPIAAPI